MRLRGLLSSLVLLVLAATCVEALFEGMYCGKQNCYDVLGVDANVNKKEMARIYRKLQKERHPDRNPEAMKNPEQYAELQKEWHRIRIAYETLKDDESRKNYDYLLANPDEFYRHWWYYHRTRVSQQLNVWGVLFVLISLISAGQFYFINWSYQHNLSGALGADDKILRHYVNRADRDGHGARVKTGKGKDLAKPDQIKAILELYGEEMAVEANLEQCEWKDVLWMRLLTYPLWLPHTVVSYIRWYHRRYRGEEYNEYERNYLTRKVLYVSEKNWGRYTDDQRADLIERELWVPENYAAYKEEQEEAVINHFLSPSEAKRYKKQKKRG